MEITDIDIAADPRLGHIVVLILVTDLGLRGVTHRVAHDLYALLELVNVVLTDLDLLGFVRLVRIASGRLLRRGLRAGLRGRRCGRLRTWLCCGRWRRRARRSGRLLRRRRSRGR